MGKRDFSGKRQAAGNPCHVCLLNSTVNDLSRNFLCQFIHLVSHQTESQVCLQLHNVPVFFHQFHHGL